MRRSIVLGVSICAVLITFGSAATNAGLAWIKQFDACQSMIIKVIAGTDCAVCCHLDAQYNCDKWCKFPCKDIIVINNAYVDSTTKKPVLFKIIPGIDKTGTSK